MTNLSSEQLPDDPNRLPPARRRRARRLLAPLGTDERATFLDRMAHRASPSFDFFLFSLACGVVVGLGILLDSPGIVLLGALVAPLMAPVVGMALGTVIGSLQFFIRSLNGLLIGALLAVAGGVVVGMLARLLLLLGFQFPYGEALHLTRFIAINFLVITAGMIYFAATMTHPDRSPILPSVVLAYTLYSPLAASGFGLAAGVAHTFPDGLAVFIVNLSCAAIVGAITLAVVGFHPPTPFGYTLGGAVALLGLMFFIGFSGAGVALSGHLGLPTPIPSATPSLTHTSTHTTTPMPPTLTPSLTSTITMTPTRTATPIPSPTPLFAVISAAGGEGVLLREQPDGAIQGSLVNGSIVAITGEIKFVAEAAWVPVLLSNGKSGWVKLSYLATVTPGAP